MSDEEIAVRTILRYLRQKRIKVKNEAKEICEMESPRMFVWHKFNSDVFRKVTPSFIKPCLKWMNNSQA